jgi:succinyl-CoA synthetase beta subunit
VNIHEYQAAELFAKYGLPVNPGRVARTPEEAAQHALAFGGTVVLKAQVHSGGRGKAGGVKLAKSAEEAAERAGQIFGLDIRGHIVKKILVAPGADIAREYYLGAILDREARGITMMGSSEGGVEIEEVAKTNPEAIVKVTADPLLGLQDYQARQLAFGMGHRGVGDQQLRRDRQEALQRLRRRGRLPGRDQPPYPHRRWQVGGDRLQDGPR